MIGNEINGFSERKKGKKGIKKYKSNSWHKITLLFTKPSAYLLTSKVEGSFIFNSAGKKKKGTLR
ncbi:MAG: hypothetical protein D3905_07900 [Candidatus Electrothrix sp. AS4_5]|nr:hypothetical protein [Candidatus Electrothrix gigas]